VICGEPSHGRCERPKKCRNCEGEHKSTDKKCSIYEWNKNIVTIMSYNNVSHREAVLILKGKEDNQNLSSYNRYEEPSQWTKLPKSRRENKMGQNRDFEEERRSPESSERIVGARQDTRSYTPRKENREYLRRPRETYNQEEKEREKKKKTNENEKEKKNRLHDTYDQREEESIKEDRGIVLKKTSNENSPKTDMTTHREYRSKEESLSGSFAQNRGEVTELYSDRDQTIELCAKLVKVMLKDNDLRRVIFAMLEGHYRVDPDTRRSEDREEEEVLKKKKKRRRNGRREI